MYIGSIVLAGGRSRRMGKPKESLPFLGTSLLGRTVETLMLCTHPVLVVARDSAQDLPPLPLECDVTFDREPEGGPLYAFATGLRAVAGQCDAVFVSSCDMPFLHERVVHWLATEIGDAALAIPSVEGVLQPLAALYRTSVAEEVERLLAEGERSLRSVAERVSTRVLDEAAIDRLDPTRKFLRNVNQPEDYEAAVREIEGA